MIHSRIPRRLFLKELARMQLRMCIHTAHGGRQCRVHVNVIEELSPILFAPNTIELAMFSNYLHSAFSSLCDNE